MIGLFNDCFPPIMDGVAIATANYAYWLNRKGKDVCVVTTSVPHHVDNQPYNIYRYASLPIIGRKPYRLGFPGFDIPFQNRIKQIPFEIVHAHCPFSSGKVAMKIAKKNHIPLVATFHSKYRSDFERAMPCKMIVDHIIKGVVDFYEHADEVWIPQASVEETLREYGYRGKVQVVDNGNDFAGTYSEDEKSTLRKKMGIADDEHVLLFVGQHIWEKNIEFIIRSLQLIKPRINFRMYFVGTGYAEKEIALLASELGLKDNVCFVGPVYERQKIREYYLISDLFVFPSLYDNAPLVVREAAALHTPSLLIEGSTASGVITDNVNGFLAPDNLESFAGRICSILKDKTLMTTVSSSAASTLTRSWQDIMEEVEDRYNHIIKRMNTK